MTERFASALDLASRRRPSQPVLCRRPHAITDQANAFARTFPGDVLYIPAGEPHSYEVVEAPFEFLCMVPNEPDQLTILDITC